jgi:hypothetical protein
MYIVERKNMKKTILGLGLASMFLSVSAAHAEVGLSTELGTTGVGIHATLPVLTNLNARIGVNAFSYSYNGSTSNVDYKFKLKLQTFDLLADYYPIAASGFRLTGGLIYNGNKVDATGKPNQTGTYTLNGNTYSSSSVGSLNGRVDFRKIAPYVGLGWGNALAKDSNWSFTTDIGAMFQGAARTSLTSSDCTASTAICSQLASDLSAENQKLADKTSKLKIWPVIRFGVAYKF